MSEIRVLMDMDGVLVDFCNGLCEVLGLDNPYHQGKGAGEWNMWEILGITEEEFWSPCEDPDFWSSLDWNLDGQAILRSAEKLVGEENVYLLTSPSLAPEAWLGKARWVKRELPNYRTRLLMGSCKHLCAKPGQVLVDDADHNVEKFRELGGQAVLVPRPWNALYPKHGNALGETHQALWEATL